MPLIDTDVRETEKSRTYAVLEYDWRRKKIPEITIALSKWHNA